MERKGFIGGSDAKRILDGEWFPLWQEKTGRVEPENLSYNFQAQLGKVTEPFHLNWLNAHHGFEITWRGNVMTHPDLPWMRATLDGWSVSNDTFVEVKHSNARATRDSIVEWYLPQVAHTCAVTERLHGWVSYIAGNEAPDFFKLAPSLIYIDALVEAETAFWWHVENDVAPEMIINERTVAQAAQEARNATVDDMRVVDMTGNNEWAVNAALYIGLKEDAARFEKAKKTLKEMVEPDVRIAAGHGLILKRSKSGSLLFSETGT